MAAPSHKILLAEDSQSQITYIKKILSGHFPDMEIFSCASGKKALERLNQESFSLVIVSYRLPDMSGVDLLSSISQIAPSVPVIMMTAETSADVILEVMRKGAYDYILKTREGLKMLPVVVIKGLKRYLLIQEREAYHRERENLVKELQEANHELLKAQEALVKAERMAAIGLVSMTVSHEINNPLTSVMGFAELLSKRKDLPVDVHEKILKIYQNSLRIRDIIHKLTQLNEEKRTEVGKVPILDLHGKR